MSGVVIFCPVLKSWPTGYLYGWSSRDGNLICVVDVISTDSENESRRRLERAINANPACKGIEILGWCGSSNECPLLKPLRIILKHGALSTIQLEDHSNPPAVVLYRKPKHHKMQFLSTIPLDLDLANWTPSSRPSQMVVSGRVLESLRLDRGPNTAMDDGRFEALISQLNSADMVDRVLGSKKNSGPSTQVQHSTLASYLDKFLSPLSVVSGLCSLEVPFAKPNALKDLCATAQQLDLRATQISSWPRQYSVLANRNAKNLALRVAQYTSFYNTLWLIANDVIIGIALASLVCENSAQIAAWSSRAIQVYTIDGVRDTLLWLNEWPAGLKLDYELGKFICDTFIWCTIVWEKVVTYIDPHLDTLVYSAGITGYLGATMLFSVVSDLLSLFTAHIYLFYALATAIFSSHLSVLYVLFNVFRGKKLNILRHRIEPASYDADELLLGTILFTVLVFLFPTILVYYLVFAVTRLGIIILHATMECCLAAMNHFPLFALMLRVKDPARLPGGVKLASVSRHGELWLQLENQPLPFSAIFFQYWRLWRRLAAHYSPIYVGSRLFSGSLISPIPRARLHHTLSFGNL